MKKSLTKLWKVMKICAAQVMIALIISGISVAHDNYGQLLDRKVSLSLNDVSLKAALKEIETVADIRIFYSIDQLGFDESISIEAEDEPLRFVLDGLLGDYDIKYKVDEKKRVISLKRERDLFKGSKTIPDEQLLIPSREAADYTITGSVSDRATQQPMAGVNVIVKGTTIGTTTDADGKYTIQAEDNSVLVFSFIGYATFETSVGGRSVIDVLMDEDVQSLNQVVINAGYWNVKDREKTGNITKITGEDLEKQPVQNPLAALQASVPGLQITQLTGVPGGNFTVRIRGQSSIGNGNDPLFIVDGVPFTSNTLSTPITSQNILFQGTNPLNMLSPADIESIEILKDADATAIYGSRGANGVILITTRKGYTGKTKVAVSIYSGVGQVASKMKLLNTSDYLEMRREAYANDNLTPSTSGAPDLLVWDTTRFTDWQRELIGGTAHTTDGQFSISGGTQSTRYYFSTGYHKEGSVFPGDNADKRISTHLDVSNVSSDGKFESFVRMNYSINDTEFINRDLTTLALTLPPNAPELYNDAGELNWGPQAWNASMPHPLQHLATGYESITKNLVANAGFQYSPIKNLSVNLNFGYTDLKSDAISTVPVTFYYPPQRTFRENGSTFSNRYFGNWNVEPQVSGRFDVGLNGKVDVLLGTTFLHQLTEGSYIGGSGYANESLMKNIQAASTVQIGTVDYNEYRYNAVFARVNYSLRERYIINITGRRDGSSRFGPGRQYANFGAVGVAWIFSEEQFSETLFPFLSFGKLRSSYGITGNDQISDYQYMDTYAPSRAYRGVAGLSPVRLSNADFAWETNTKYEAGLELGFLRDRLSTAFSYYRNVSSDQLVGTPLAPTAGFATVQSNFPAVVENTGWEVALSSENIDKPSFSWATSLNFTLPENKLLEFPNLEASPQYASTLVVGEPLSIKKAYRYLGVDPSTGLYEFADANDDGVLDDRDRETIKFIGQRCYGGLQNAFKYRGFELKILLQFVKQSGPNYITYMTTPGGRRNSPEYVLTRWKKEGDNTDIQKYTVVGPAFFIYSDYFRNSDRSVGDASFLRLKNVYFSYTFPKGWTERIHLGSARVFLQGQNLLTISNYEGLDPETFGFALPPLRVATAGLQIEF